MSHPVQARLYLRLGELVGKWECRHDAVWSADLQRGIAPDGGVVLLHNVRAEFL